MANVSMFHVRDQSSVMVSLNQHFDPIVCLVVHPIWKPFVAIHRDVALQTTRKACIATLP